MSELHVVALSGGKDSTALALRLAEIEPREYTYVCTPTGDELPEMFAHWRMLGDLLGSPLVPVMHRTGLNGLIAEQRALPNWRQRWCTRILKIEPYAAWLKSQRADRIVSYVGTRADEEERDAGDYSEIPGVEMCFPLREWGWGMSKVWGYLEQRGVSIPARTDCARCFYQRLEEWWRLWKEHPESYANAERQEQEVSAIRGKPTTFRSPSRDKWPTSLRDLRLKFEQGSVPTRANQGTLFESLKCRVCRT